jgi:hypothetical protein
MQSGCSQDAVRIVPWVVVVGGPVDIRVVAHAARRTEHWAPSTRYSAWLLSIVSILLFTYIINSIIAVLGKRW